MLLTDIGGPVKSLESLGAEEALLGGTSTFLFGGGGDLGFVSDPLGDFHPKAD